MGDRKLSWMGNSKQRNESSQGQYSRLKLVSHFPLLNDGKIRRTASLRRKTVLLSLKKKVRTFFCLHTDKILELKNTATGDCKTVYRSEIYIRLYSFKRNVSPETSCPSLNEFTN